MSEHRQDAAPCLEALNTWGFPVKPSQCDPKAPFLAASGKPPGKVQHPEPAQGSVPSQASSRPWWGWEPARAEPTRGMPDLVFPLVTHGKIFVLQRPLGMTGVSASVPRSAFFIFFFKDLWYENIWDPDLPAELASPEGIFPPPPARVRGWLCKPRSVGRLGSSPVALPGLNFFGIIIIIIFERFLYNGRRSLEGFHRPAPASLRAGFGTSASAAGCAGPSRSLSARFAAQPGGTALGMGCKSNPGLSGCPCRPPGQAGWDEVGPRHAAQLLAAL